jgi:hypothetical protein
MYVNIHSFYFGINLMYIYMLYYKLRKYNTHKAEKSLMKIMFIPNSISYLYAYFFYIFEIKFRIYIHKFLRTKIFPFIPRSSFCFMYIYIYYIIRFFVSMDRLVSQKTGFSILISNSSISYFGVLIVFFKIQRIRRCF